MKFLFVDGDQDVSRHGAPYLGLHRVLTGGQKSLDAQMLLDPLEEQLNLPTALVQRADGQDRSRHAFVGVSVNLNELLFGRRVSQEPALKNAGRLFFEHIQLPYTAIRSSREF